MVSDVRGGPWGGPPVSGAPRRHRAVAGSRCHRGRETGWSQLRQRRPALRRHSCQRRASDVSRAPSTFASPRVKFVAPGRRRGTAFVQLSFACSRSASATRLVRPPWTGGVETRPSPAIRCERTRRTPYGFLRRNPATARSAAPRFGRNMAYARRPQPGTLWNPRTSPRYTGRPLGDAGSKEGEG